MTPSPKARSQAGLSASRWRSAAVSIWSAGLNLLYPPRCAGCGRIDTYWCANCQHILDETSLLLPLQTLPPLSAAAATTWHEGVARGAVHALKYEACRPMAHILGRRMAAALDRLKWPVDGLVPVPLHPTRLKERGYNQAQWLAEAVAPLTGIECLPQGLARVRSTPHQVGASAAERRANMENAFEPAGSALQGRRVVLLDDVFTTGATLQACAQAAFAGGALAVFSLTATAARPAGTA